MDDEFSYSTVTIEAMVKIIRGFGVDATVEDVEADIEEGAPVNADGTMNLFLYMAWSLKHIAEYNV